MKSPDLGEFHAEACDIIFGVVFVFRIGSQPAFTCSKLIIETLEQGVKYVQSEQ